VNLYVRIYFIFLLIATQVLVALPAPAPKGITIFVHGTFGLKKNMSLNTVFQLWRDKIDNTPYKCKVEAGRTDTYFYMLQPMQERGLKKIMLESPRTCYRGPEIFASTFDDIARSQPYYEPTQYYTFGWSGLLSAKQRLLEAGDLYAQLKQERLQFKMAYGYDPKITLIGYSHGGNLCLNLAHIRKLNYAADDFCIDHLILFGTPIQETTDYLIYEPIFKNITHIYSAGDRIQRLDLFSSCNFISHKKFKPQYNNPLPTKLTQIKILISEQCKKTDSGTYQRRRISKAPGHIELWFFGWTPSMYRKSFSFYPLPFAVFIPYLLSAVQQYMPDQRKINFQIKPDHTQAYLATDMHEKLTIPFLPLNFVEQLQNKALAHHPDYFFIQDRPYYHQLSATPKENQLCSFAELVKEVYPQVKRKYYNGKTANCFSTCDGVAKSNA
jgi:hypothetical protein